MNVTDRKTAQIDCMICRQMTQAKFTKPLFETDIVYYECKDCSHLTASFFDPDKIYGEKAYFTEVDSGWAERNRRVLHFLNLFTRVPGIDLPKGVEALDYGCGVGSLVDDLVDQGYDAYGYEPFPNPNMRSERVLTEWHQLKKAGKQPQLITLIEVMEHLRAPEKQLADIQRIIKPKGYLLVSTGMFRNDIHDENWFYLSPRAGHVSIYSEQSICDLLKQYNFLPVFRVNENLWLFRQIEKRTLVENGLLTISNRRVQAKYQKLKKS